VCSLCHRGFRLIAGEPLRKVGQPCRSGFGYRHRHPSVHLDILTVRLDRDILTCPLDDVRSIQAEQTWLGGKLVYERKWKRWSVETASHSCGTYPLYAVMLRDVARSQSHLRPQMRQSHPCAIAQHSGADCDNLHCLPVSPHRVFVAGRERATSCWPPLF
jgi:hypothetical protein